jgi:hypothetical protein
MLKTFRKRERARASRRMRTTQCMRPHASRRIAARFAGGTPCACVALRCSSAGGRGCVAYFGETKQRWLWPSEPNCIVAGVPVFLFAAATIIRNKSP